MALRCGLVGLVAMALGPVGCMLGLLRPMWGFGLFALGGVLGLAALIAGIIGLVRRQSGAAPAAALGAGAVAILIAAAVPGFGLPPINDITTDPNDPPEFGQALKEPANADRDMKYPGGSFETQQRAAYPDLGPIELALPPAEAMEHVRHAADSLGWNPITTDSRRGVLEAQDTSGIFRFVDDIVVRVRASGSGSRVDVRSKSRDGRGDLGANAERIRAFRAALEAQS